MESRNGTVRGMLDLWLVSCFNSSQILRGVMEQGCNPKKEVVGRLKQDLDKDL